MNYIDQYLKKNNFIPSIHQKPDKNLGICIVIPAYNEPDLLNSLNTLWNCYPTRCSVEIIVVVNAPASSSDLTKAMANKMVNDVLSWINLHVNPSFRIFILPYLNLPDKDAGVGLARKLGMDAAIHRFYLAEKDGIIAGFDADALCTPNYLQELESHFKINPGTPGASIYFEHPLHSDNKILDEGIVLYELHLRYLLQALRYASFPNAFHTVGSSFAVRSGVYVRQGGMNKRKAGEDFYFLQKVIALGKFSEINSTCIMPSSRISDRVPFGTGASMRHWLSGEGLTTYCLEAFNGIKIVVDHLVELYKNESTDDFLGNLPEQMRKYLLRNNFNENLSNIKANCASLETFQKRFYRWFDPFMVIKYLNFVHSSYYSKSLIPDEALKLLQAKGILFNGNTTDLLLLYRKLDRNGLGEF